MLLRYRLPEPCGGRFSLASLVVGAEREKWRIGWYVFGSVGGDEWRGV